jgi:hypothetical protein
MRDIWKLAVKTRLDTVTYTRFTETLIPSTTCSNTVIGRPTDHVIRI